MKIVFLIAAIYLIPVSILKVVALESEDCPLKYFFSFQVIYGENHLVDPVQAHAYCLRAYRITVFDLKDHILGKDVPRLDCYFRCLLLKLGYIDHQNNINVENISKYFKVYFDLEIPDEVKIQAETIYQTCKEQISCTEDRCVELQLIGKCLVEQLHGQGQSNKVLEVVFFDYSQGLFNILPFKSDS